MARSAILLISCPDRTGLVATITDFLYRNNGNILHLDQHVDAEENVFFMRVEWDLDGFALPRRTRSTRSFRPIAERFDMRWALHFSDDVPRMAVFVSKQGHCLYDLLARAQSGEWQRRNSADRQQSPRHGDGRRQFGIDYHQFTHEREQARTGTGADRAAARLQGRFHCAGALHADFVAGVCQRSTRRRSSTFITRSCPRSSARNRITRLMRAASR